MTTDRSAYRRQQMRTILLRTWTPGDPCPRCGRGMWNADGLDVGHVVPFALGGTFADGAQLEHSSCSRSAGARFGNKLRRVRRTTQPATRRW